MTFLVFLALGLLIRTGIVVLGGNPLGATYAAALFVLVVTTTGFVVEELRFGRILMLLLAVALGGLAYRLERSPLFRAIFFWGAVALLAYPLILLVSRIEPGGEAHVAVGGDLAVSAMSTTPDFVVVVLDAYASEAVFEEFYDYSNEPFVEELMGAGFVVENDMVSNYGLTQLSVPSVFELDYVAGEHEISRRDVESLLGVLGGDSSLSRYLDDNGYQTVYVESGWLGTRCSGNVDECVTAPWPDETVYDVAYRTLLRGLPGFEVGRSFTTGAQHAMAWMEDELPTYLDNETADFIYVHLLVPHPPLFLDRGCNLDIANGVDGFSVAEPWASSEELAHNRGRYIQQVECVNQTLAALADLVDGDDVVVMFGDHGPDSLGQLYKGDDLWTDEQARERFGVFLATRAPGCELRGMGSLVNVNRRIVSCLSGDDLADLPVRTFETVKVSDTTSVIEVESPS